MPNIPSGEDAAPVDPTLFTYLIFEDDEDEDEDAGE
jgi:hypothetical protein